MPQTTNTERTTRRRTRTPENHLRRADPVLAAVIDEVVREAGGIHQTLPPDPALAAHPNIPADRATACSYGRSSDRTSRTSPRARSSAD